MRSKGMFMLDLLSNAVGANLILLFLFIAMTGAEPPRGRRPLGGGEPHAALFLQVTIKDPEAKVHYSLLPPEGVNEVSSEILQLTPDPPQASTRAIFVPRLTPGCWRLVIEYVEHSAGGGFDGPRLPFDFELWLSGLTPLNVDGRVVDSGRGRVSVLKPLELPSSPPSAQHWMFRAEEIDPQLDFVVDIDFQEEGRDLPAGHRCAQLPWEG